MIAGLQAPKIHLWVFNHPLEGISDQLDFFTLLMKQYGYQVSISRRPRLDALNIVIENFSDRTSNTLIDFCKQTGKRVALIMTEHLDLKGDQLLIHGDPLWTRNDYMHASTQVARIKNLMDCVPWLRAIFVLGDLPSLEGADLMFPGVPLRALPFPVLRKVDVSKHAPLSSFVFTGYRTTFREQVLQMVCANNSLEQAVDLLPRKERDKLNARGRVVLNIPQRPRWRWLSLMRIYAALKIGRATVSIATNDTSWISRCCTQVSVEEVGDKLKKIVCDWRNAYDMSYERYEQMRLDFLNERGFPKDLFEYWAILEKNSLLN